MYVRQKCKRTRVSLQEQRVYFQKFSSVFLDTYFNALSVNLWKESCNIENLNILIEGKGRFIVKINVHRAGYPHTTLLKQEIFLENDSKTIPLPFWKDLNSGLLYVEFSSLTDGHISRADFATPDPPRNDVKLGIVITHFKRQKWVLPAIRRINSQLLSLPEYRNKVSAFIVDNSRDIDPDDVPAATVIPNENYGGSGGFTRGLMHLSQNGFSHCLFMDDDASCEIESIKRTVAILQYAISDRVAVSGAMLLDVEPYRIHEKGARYNNGDWKPHKSGLDVRNIHDLVACEDVQDQSNYGAWWMFGFAISRVKLFPFPFFARGDDVLFGITNDFQITTAIGISVWAEDFALKESPMKRYLGLRAILAIMLMTSDSSRPKIVWTMASWFLRANLSYNYDSAYTICLAIKHVSQGDRFWRDNMDMSEIRALVSREAGGEKLSPVARNKFNLAFRGVEESRIRKIVRIATLNGFILPNFLLKDEVMLNEKSFSGTLSKIFRYKSVLYEYEPLSIGYVGKHDKRLFFSRLFEFLKLIFLFLLNFKTIKESQRTALDSMTTKEFWTNVYADRMVE